MLSKAEGFGPSPPSLKKDAQRMQYETSDAIMDRGSRRFLFGEDAGAGANKKPTLEPEEKLVDDLDEEQDLLISFSPDSASTKPQVDSTATTTTLQDLWRLDAVSANDEKRRELQKENIVERDGDGPEICQKFVKTVIDANGSRRVAPCSDESLL
ncbi:hypothetical protein CDD81_4716 [Ophiocordyceps australis]|uniref:Uncharacterized protein n=1 Tax=Ophiocordyceps australis TaxID=1399860 RepID=A0A2C5XAC8_9HYPO|nr:hypothetical protein CDD81_4716 [Ophiocordyceps australis]